jgi:ParB family chromosome partitioning protein
MAQWQMKHVKPQDIVVKDQVRKESDPKKQEELNASVKAHGILQPLLVTVFMVLLAGHRRLAAALAAGLETVPVIITDRVLSDSEIRVIQLTENMHRADLKAIEQVEGVEELARLNPEKTNKELAELLSIDPSMMTRLRSVSKVIPAARDALAAGKIGLSTAYAISKCGSPAEQERMLAQALSGASRDAIEQAGRKTRSPAVATVRLSRIKAMLPSGVVIVASGEGLTLDDLIESLAEAQREARKARDQGLDARTFQAVLRDKAKKGGES